MKNLNRGEEIVHGQDDVHDGQNRPGRTAKIGILGAAVLGASLATSAEAGLPPQPGVLQEIPRAEVPLPSEETKSLEARLQNFLRMVEEAAKKAGQKTQEHPLAAAGALGAGALNLLLAGAALGRRGRVRKDSPDLLEAADTIIDNAYARLVILRKKEGTLPVYGFSTVIGKGSSVIALSPKYAVEKLIEEGVEKAGQGDCPSQEELQGRRNFLDRALSKNIGDGIYAKGQPIAVTVVEDCTTRDVERDDELLVHVLHPSVLDSLLRKISDLLAVTAASSRGNNVPSPKEKADLVQKVRTLLERDQTGHTRTLASYDEENLGEAIRVFEEKRNRIEIMLAEDLTGIEKTGNVRDAMLELIRAYNEVVDAARDKERAVQDFHPDVVSAVRRCPDKVLLECGIQRVRVVHPNHEIYLSLERVAELCGCDPEFLQALNIENPNLNRGPLHEGDELEIPKETISRQMRRKISTGDGRSQELLFKQLSPIRIPDNSGWFQPQNDLPLLMQDLENFDPRSQVSPDETVEEKLRRAREALQTLREMDTEILNRLRATGNQLVSRIYGNESREILKEKTEGIRAWANKVGLIKDVIDIATLSIEAVENIDPSLFTEEMVLQALDGLMENANSDIANVPSKGGRRKHFEHRLATAYQRSKARIERGITRGMVMRELKPEEKIGLLDSYKLVRSGLVCNNFDEAMPGNEEVSLSALDLDALFRAVKGSEIALSDGVDKTVKSIREPNRQREISEAISSITDNCGVEAPDKKTQFAFATIQTVTGDEASGDPKRAVRIYIVHHRGVDGAKDLATGKITEIIREAIEAKDSEEFRESLAGLLQKGGKNVIRLAFELKRYREYLAIFQEGEK